MLQSTFWPSTCLTGKLQITFIHSLTWQKKVTKHLHPSTHSTNYKAPTAICSLDKQKIQSTFIHPLTWQKKVTKHLKACLDGMILSAWHNHTWHNHVWFCQADKIMPSKQALSQHTTLQWKSKKAPSSINLTKKVTKHLQSSTPLTK